MSEVKLILETEEEANEQPRCGSEGN